MEANQIFITFFNQTRFAFWSNRQIYSTFMCGSILKGHDTWPVKDNDVMRKMVRVMKTLFRLVFSVRKGKKISAIKLNLLQLNTMTKFLENKIKDYYLGRNEKSSWFSKCQKLEDGGRLANGSKKAWIK